MKLMFVLSLLVFSATSSLFVESVSAAAGAAVAPAGPAGFDATKLEFEDNAFYGALAAASKTEFEQAIVKLSSEHRSEYLKALAIGVEKLQDQALKDAYAKFDEKDGDKFKEPDEKKRQENKDKWLEEKRDNLITIKEVRDALLACENKHTEEHEKLTQKYADNVLNDEGKQKWKVVQDEWIGVGVKDANSAQVKGKTFKVDAASGAISDDKPDAISKDAVESLKTIWDKKKRQEMMKVFRDARTAAYSGIFAKYKASATEVKDAAVKDGAIKNNESQQSMTGQVIAGAGGDLTIKYCDVASKDISKEAFQMLCIGGGDPSIVDCSKGTLKGGFQLTFDKACYAMATDAIHNVEYYRHAKGEGQGGGRVPSYKQPEELQQMIDWEHMSKIVTEKHAAKAPEAKK